MRKSKTLWAQILDTMLFGALLVFSPIFAVSNAIQSRPKIWWWVSFALGILAGLCLLALLALALQATVSSSFG